MLNKLKYILIALLSIAGLFFALKTKNKANTEVENNNAVNDLIQKGHSLTFARYLNKIALSCAHHLGTAYTWYNTSSWTENDKEVFSIVQPLTRSELNDVAFVYAKYYTNKKGRSLHFDLRKFLDNKYYSQLENL